MIELQKLTKQIEELRESINKIKMSRGLMDPEIVISSHLFDDVLNEYYLFIKKKHG